MVRSVELTVGDVFPEITGSLSSRLVDSVKHEMRREKDGSISKITKVRLKEPPEWRMTGSS